MIVQAKIQNRVRNFATSPCLLPNFQLSIIKVPKLWDSIHPSSLLLFHSSLWVLLSFLQSHQIALFSFQNRSFQNEFEIPLVLKEFPPRGKQSSRRHFVIKHSVTQINTQSCIRYTWIQRAYILFALYFSYFLYIAIMETSTMFELFNFNKHLMFYFMNFLKVASVQFKA